MHKYTKNKTDQTILMRLFYQRPRWSRPNARSYSFSLQTYGLVRKFCIEKSLDFGLVDEIYDEIILEKGDLFIAIVEDDLVNLTKRIGGNEFEIGKDIGVPSYNDTPLKDLLGILVISIDFKIREKVA